MKQQYIDKITKACIKANPEIVELKFGCKILVDYHECLDVLTEHIIYETYFSKDFIEVRACDNNAWYGEDWLNLKPEIIGRPIQLADVLLMIDKEYEGCVFVTISSNGFLKVDGLNRTEQPKWNLTKPLEEQSEETLKFISELLK